MIEESPHDSRICWIIDLSYIHSWIASISKGFDDVTTIVCLTDLHETIVPLQLNTYPVCDLPLCESKRYLADPHKGRSQTWYVFNCNGTTISWRSVKQTMVATSSNHSKILIIHEACRECMYLRSMIQHIRESCRLSSIKEEWWNCYSTNKIKWQFSRSIHKGIVNCNT